MKLYGEDLMRMQTVSKWCRELEKGRKGFHHNDRTGQRSTSRTEWNATGERSDWCFFFFWGGLQVTFRDLSSALVLSLVSLHNAVHECKSPSLHCDGIFKFAPKWSKCMIMARKYVEIKRHTVSRQWKNRFIQNTGISLTSQGTSSFSGRTFLRRDNQMYVIYSSLCQCGHKSHRGE